MTANKKRDAEQGINQSAKNRAHTARRERGIESAVRAAILNGFVIGREVFLERVPGIVVAYNITSFGHFIGAAYPLVVRTAYGVTKCRLVDVRLA